MNGMQAKKRNTGRTAMSLGRLCLVVNLLAYIGFALADGPVWCRDSNSYATMDYTREPAYCTFLWLMRKVFGDTVLVHGWDLTDRLGGKAAAQEPLYLMAAIVCQAALMAVTVWYLARLCRRLGGRRLALAANGVMWGVELLNRFGAKRGSAYFQSIMTEGFGIPFYILFLLFLFQYLRSRPGGVFGTAPDGGNVKTGAGTENADGVCGREFHETAADGKGKMRREWLRYLLAAAGMMTLCTSHHKQLGITLLIFAVCTVGADLFALLRSAQAGKRPLRHSMFVWDMAALAGAGVLIFLIGHLYNLAFHGVWSFHTGSADKIDSTLLYTVTEDDAALFDRYGSSELKGLFLQIEEQMEAQSLRYADVMGEETAGSGAASPAVVADAENAADAGESGAASGEVSWVELCSHYADSYDIIGFEVLDPLVDAYVREHSPELTPGSMEFAIAADEVCQELEHVLVHQNLTRLVHLWVNNVRKGFVNTVLRVSTVLNWASLVLWMFYIGLLGRLVYGIRNGMRKASGSDDDTRHSAEDNRFAKKGHSIEEDQFAGKGAAAVQDHVTRKRDIALLAGLVLIGTAINCMVVGAIIFPQTRYMIYNMGMFYVCLLAMAGCIRRSLWVRRDSAGGAE